MLSKTGVILISAVTAMAVAIMAYEAAKVDPRWILLAVFLIVWGALYREISKQDK